LKIPKEDAIIIFLEFDKIVQDDLYIGVSINEFYKNKISFRKLFNYIRYFNIVGRIDRLIDAMIKKGKFTAYVPVLTLIGKSLITHSNCCAFNFIEEGLAQYYKEETLESLNPINSKDLWRSSILRGMKRVLNEIYLVLRGYNFKLQSLPFSYSCYNSFKNVTFYGLTQESYPLIDNRKKVIIPFEQKSFGLVRHDYNINLNDKIVWVGDSSVIRHGFSQSLYIQGIKEGCIEFIKRKGEKDIFIKFHRDEPDDLRQTIKVLFKNNGISFQIIPDSIIMELLLFEAKNVTLIGVYSSLLYYASIMGHHSFSIYEFLQKEYSKVLKNRDFGFYWNRVILIKPVNTNYQEIISS
jgi:hypothetical protein